MLFVSVAGAQTKDTLSILTSSDSTSGYVTIERTVTKCFRIDTLSGFTLRRAGNRDHPQLIIVPMVRIDSVMAQFSKSGYQRSFQWKTMTLFANGKRLKSIPSTLLFISDACLLPPEGK